MKNNELKFWDYIKLAFYTKFAQKKLLEVGPARATIWVLPNGKTFLKASPLLQTLRPLTTTGPLPMPQAMAMAIIEEAEPGVVGCTSASFELDDEFEANIQNRDVAEMTNRQNSIRDLDVDAIAQDLIAWNDYIDHNKAPHLDPKKES
jgi:hypothetical protein